MEGRIEDRSHNWILQPIFAVCLQRCPLLYGLCRCFHKVCGTVCSFHYDLPSFAAEARPDRKVFLPPKLEDLMAWSVLFRSEGTFSNYVGYVKTACLLCKASVKAASLNIVISDGPISGHLQQFRRYSTIQRLSVQSFQSPRGLTSSRDRSFGSGGMHLYSCNAAISQVS